MHKLPNYLRTFRKKSYLSQDEVAFLLGSRSGAKISRYERFSREPTLKTALAYEALFGIPVQSLFAGTFQKVEAEIKRRAQLLTRKLGTAKSGPVLARKLEALKPISGLRIEPGKNS